MRSTAVLGPEIVSLNGQQVSLETWHSSINGPGPRPGLVTSVQVSVGPSGSTAWWRMQSWAEGRAGGARSEGGACSSELTGVAQEACSSMGQGPRWHAIPQGLVGVIVFGFFRTICVTWKENQNHSSWFMIFP